MFSEYALAIFCVFVALKDFLQYLGYCSIMPVELTPLQKRLMGIKDNGKFFSFIYNKNKLQVYYTVWYNNSSNTWVPQCKSLAASVELVARSKAWNV